MGKLEVYTKEHYTMSSKENNKTIEKFTGSFSAQKGGCTIVVNSTINSITNPVALAIYCYLMCKPDTWQLNVKQLSTHFKSGRNTIYKCLTLLMEMKLLTREDIREKGQFSKSHYMLYEKPIPCTESQENIEKPQCLQGISPCPSTRDTVSRDTATRHTYKTKNIKNKESKKTTTTLARKTAEKSSSSDFVISEKMDKELLEERKKHLQADELDRTDEEFLRQCSHHLDNGDKNKYNLSRRLAGLKSIIKLGNFEKPAGYDEKKIVKSLHTPEESALLYKYEHALRMEKLGIKIQDFFPDPQELKKAMQLKEKYEIKPSLSKRIGGIIGFGSK